MPGRIIAAPALSRADMPRRYFEWSLLGMLTSGYFGVLGSGQLDPLAALVMFLALATRALMVAGVITLQVPPRLVTALALLYLVYFPLDYVYISGSFLPALTHMIFFVAVVKLLTAASSRDYMYLKIIATLELLAAALLSTSISFFLFLAIFLLCAIGAFSSGEIVRASQLAGEAPTGKPVSEDKARAMPRQRVSRAGLTAFPRRLTVLTSFLFLGILAMTAGLFFILPRTARAALQRFVPERYHLPGFSNEVTLGEIGEIKQSSAPVMHVRPLLVDVAGTATNQPNVLTSVRWRGSTLRNFDGARWFNPSTKDELVLVRNGEVVLPPVPNTRGGRSISYEVELDEIAPDTLLFAGTPQTIRIETRALWRTSGGGLRAPQLRLNGLRYAAYSFLENESGQMQEIPRPLPPEERSALLALPAIDTRIYDLARQWTALARSPEQKAREMERRLRSDYGYTLELLPENVADPLSHFLFERREGHCEYFASALAVMLRTQGIPSRVATGFLSGVYNPMTGWQVVRAADAHSWVEAWIDGRGWITLDPTPPDPNAGAGGGFNRLAMLLDAAGQFWRDWVVGYDLEHQAVLASRMQEAGRSWKFDFFPDLSKWRLLGGSIPFLPAISGVSLAGAALLAYFYGPGWWKTLRGRIRLRRAKRGHAGSSDATLLYHRMLELLERRGYAKPPWLTPDEFVRVLPRSELALLVEDLTGAYNEVRFGGRAASAPRMARLLTRIEILTKA